MTLIRRRRFAAIVTLKCSGACSQELDGVGLGFGIWLQISHSELSKIIENDIRELKTLARENASGKNARALKEPRALSEGV